MTRLDFKTYRDHIVAESRRFRDVLADCDPKAHVPGCPDWNAADLLWHLAGVQHFWGTIVASRAAEPDGIDEKPPRPDGHDAMLSGFDAKSTALVAALDAADPADRVWTWSQDQTVGFVYRRQAHEALIHRFDAEQTARKGITPLDQDLAADGVHEALSVMFGGCPPWGTFTPLEHYVRVDLTDTGHSIWVQLGQFTGTDPDDDVTYDVGDINVVDDPGTDPDAVISGPAGPLDLWLWRRGDDSQVHVTGDRRIYDRFRLAVNHPLT
jgi:uncharacterized protein (TIGR03083 family)